MARKLLLHLGPHKTGTTFLQKALHRQWQATKAFSYSSVHSSHKQRHQMLRQALNTLRNALLTDQINSGQDALKTDVFLQAKAMLKTLSTSDPNGPIVISDENFLGVPLGQQMPGGRYFERAYYPKAAEIAVYLSHLTKEYDTTVLLCNREPRELIGSLFSNTVKNLSFAGSISEYCEENNVESIKGDLLFKRITQSFGKKAHLLEYSLLRQNPEEFINEFFKLSGVRIDVQNLPEARENSRLCDRHILKAREMMRSGNPEKLRIFRQYLVDHPATNEDQYTLSSMN